MTVQALDDQEVRRQIVNRLDEAVDAWNKGDVETYASVYLVSEFTSLISDGKRASGHRTIRRLIEEQTVEGVSLSYADLDVEVLCERYAYVSGRYTVRDRDIEEIGYFTLLMQREETPSGPVWYVFKDHSSIG